MLEQYFVKPSTIDRLRGSWIATEIEAYVAWLAEQGYSAKSVWRRVPIGFAFGEFAWERGARAVADLPAHVDAFVAARVAAHDAAYSSRPMAKEVRGPVEQMLSVVVAGFEPTGRPHHRSAVRRCRAWVLRLPGRGTGTSPGIGGQLPPLPRASSRRTFGGSASKSIQELSPAILSGFIVERAAAGLAKSTVRGSAGALRVFLRYAHRQGILASDLSDAVGWPQVYRLSNVPRSISWDDVNRVLAGVERRTVAGRRNYAILLPAGHLRAAGAGDRRAHLGRHRLEARAPGDPGAQGRPLNGLPAVPCRRRGHRRLPAAWPPDHDRPSRVLPRRRSLAPDRQLPPCRRWPALTCSRRV